MKKRNRDEEEMCPLYFYCHPMLLYFPCDTTRDVVHQSQLQRCGEPLPAEEVLWRGMDE